MDFPETVYETYVMAIPDKLCLACGRDKASSVLRSNEREIVPLCKKCSINWNFYGYAILKKTKPAKLMWNLFAYKYWHWFNCQSILSLFSDLKNYSEWAKKMKQFERRRKKNG